MSDTLRYITFDIGGRPVTVLDLNDQVFFTYAKGSLQITPPAKQRTMSTPDRRYAGSRQTAETTDNGAVSWTAIISAGSQDAATLQIENLLARAEENPLPLFLEWVPEGNSKPTYYDVRGTADWSCEYEWSQWVQSSVLLMKISIPIAPLATWARMDILDVFAVDTRSDYTYDTGASSNEEVAGGALKCAANPSTEQVARHTARGYQYADLQQTWKYVPKATISGWKGGGSVKAIDATNRIVVYVDDEGTNSRLRIDKVVAGTPTNLATTNLAARVSNGTAYWVRGRVEGNVVTAEYFTSAPGPMTTPTLTNTYTLAAGAERTTFGEGVKGYAGRVWIPKTVGAELDEYTVEPWTWRKQTLPAVLPLAGTIPGDAPARVDVTVTPSGGANAPIWALLGWGRKPPAGLAQAPFGIIEAETAGNLSGWSNTANANYRGGKGLIDAAAASTDVYTASWEVDPSLLVADAFQGEVAVEVWGRVAMDATIITPTLTLSTRPQDGLSFGAARYTDEWGSAGKLLTTPASSTEKFRPVRLGTLRMLVDTTRPRVWLLWLDGAVGAGTSGAWGIDYLVLVPATQRACGPTSKANDSGYPKFIPSTAETSKTIRTDLSAVTAKPPAFGHPDHGLGGQLIELRGGVENQLIVKLSSLAPDDPTSDATTEQLAHEATIHAAVTPRSFLWRSGS